MDSLEGMPLAGLLNGLDHGLVDAEGDGDTEQSEEQVGDHTDDAEGRQRQQQQQRHAKDDARFFGVTPVDQILHCKESETSVRQEVRQGGLESLQDL